MKHTHQGLSRRELLATTAMFAAGASFADDRPTRRKALIAITLDLEMSAQYPRPEMLEWNYRKGDLDDATKEYALRAGQIVKERGGIIHYFCVGQVLEQPSVQWLKDLAAAGHPIGNHTYDHVNVKAKELDQVQFRFQRSPWLVRGKTPRQVIEENVRINTEAMKDRAGITADGFRTPGGFHNGLADRPDVQQMLQDQGFRWVSSKYPSHLIGKPGQEPTEEVYASIVKAQAEAQPFAYPKGLVEVPMSPISDVSAFRTGRWKLSWFLEALRRAVMWAIRSGNVFDFLAHPSCLVVEDPRFESIKLLCDLVKEAGERAMIASLGAIARRAHG